MLDLSETVNAHSLACEHTIASERCLTPAALGESDRDVTQTEKPARRSRKADQRAETMEQIFDAAEELFSKHGLHGVTLKDVAKQVGVH
ncbi:MAG: TetR family transcriptional regulator, partial [Sphingomonas sp.]